MRSIDEEIDPHLVFCLKSSAKMLDFSFLLAPWVDLPLVWEETNKQVGLRTPSQRKARERPHLSGMVTFVTSQGSDFQDGLLPFLVG